MSRAVLVDERPVRQAVYRYLAGRPLIERPGVWPYLRRGDGRWAGWQRQLLRLAVPAAAVTAANSPLARAVLLVALVAASGWVRRRWRRRRFRRTYISPTVRALRVPLGIDDVTLHVDPGLGRLVARLARPLSPAEEWLRGWYGHRVEPVWRWPADQVARVGWVVWRFAGPAALAVQAWLTPPREQVGPRIRLTVDLPYVTAEQRSIVSAIVKAKIPAGELVESWCQVGPEVTATWVPRRRPPAKVGLVELEAHFARLREWEYYLGQGAGDVQVSIDLHADSPHVAVSAGTGAGKSVLAQLIAVQVLRRGGRVILLDRKGSHRWALGLDGVDYCTRPEQMHAALVRAAEIADERNTLALHEPEGWDPGERILVICEELNATIGQLATWWERNRLPSDPKRSPAITALNEVAYMGRAAKVNLIAIAQMLTARATGGPEARENFGVRCLARYTTNNWKMLVPEAAMPRASRTLGRWQVVVGGVATETQVCYLTRAQARAFARAGTRVTGHANGLDGALSSGVTGNTTKPVTQDRLVSLAEAIDAGLLPWSKAATKMRLSRARRDGRRTPKPQGRRGLQTELYACRDLVDWVESERP